MSKQLEEAQEMMEKERAVARKVGGGGGRRGKGVAGERVAGGDGEGEDCRA